jgi:hypothetical protein
MSRPTIYLKLLTGCFMRIAIAMIGTGYVGLVSGACLEPVADRQRLFRLLFPGRVDLCRAFSLHCFQ